MSAAKSTSNRRPAASKNKPATRRAPRNVYNEKHVIFFLFSICILLSFMLGSLLWSMAALRIPDIHSVSEYQPMQTSSIYDRNGRVVERIFRENRTVIPLSDMPDLLPKAFVAAEDGRFYNHPGLDFFSVIRALYVNVRRGDKAQGGSTITQQVARSLLLSREKTYLRKFKEAILAWRIDSLLRKNEIIYIYLNQIYLGGGAYGVEAAAQVYFNKRARDLNLGEMAVLAGLPQAPSRYSPDKNLEQAVKRQRYVLNRMVADGYITARQAKDAFDAGLSVMPAMKEIGIEAGYYTSIVKKRARRLVGRPLDVAGAQIYTYLDVEMQKKAVWALRSGVMASLARQKEQDQSQKKVPQGALVSLDGCSGKVWVLVGGSEYDSSHYNRAVFARRPAGSAFKPILYAAALENGWRAESLILDAPLSIPGAKGQLWQPKNYDGQYHGQVSLSQALTHSYNTAAIRLLRKVGVKKVQNLSKKMGIRAEKVGDLSLALGSVDVSLLDLTSAYAGFICDGYAVSPRFIEKITLQGGAVHHPPVQPRLKVLSGQSAAQMKRMLADVIKKGTAQRAAGLTGVSGGKTGTTNDLRDAWFIGFHGSTLTGVWVGHDKNQSLGAGETGGRTAVPIWYSFMKNSTDRR